VRSLAKKAERKGKLVIVTGVPGVGKTTVLTAVIAECKNRGLRVSHVNYGGVMFKSAKAKGLVKERDQMRGLPITVQLELQLAAAKKIRSMAGDGNVILDTHMFIRTPGGYMPGIPSWVAKSLAPDSIVLLEADAAEISRRRQKDTAIRLREADSTTKVAEHQLMGRAGAAALAVMIGCTVAIAENREGDHLAAAVAIADLFSKGS
jgi:adenylate kinase